MALRRWFVIALAAVLPFVVVGGARSADHVVVFGSTFPFAYTPQFTTIYAGDSVTWSGAFAAHPLLQTDSTFSYAVGGIFVNSGTSFTQTFSTPGAYFFRCNVHGLPPFGTMNMVVAVLSTAPSISITAPADGAFLVGTPVTISGTATDNLAVTSVGVAVYRSINGGQYWNGTAWQAQNTTVPATLSPVSGPSVAWSYSFAPPNGGGIYAVAAVAVDTNNEVGIAPYRTFHINDSIVPTVSLTAPTTNQVVSGSPVTISGTASDNAGVAAVQVAVYRPVPSQFWNGSAWQYGYTTVPATLSAPGGPSTAWTYSFAPPQTGGLYYVSAVALDTTYNYSYTSFSPFWRTDTTAPTGSVTSPVHNATVSLATSIAVTGGAGDNSGVADVRLVVYRVTDGKYYQGGTTWQTGFTSAQVGGVTFGATATTWSGGFAPVFTGTFLVATLVYDTNYNYTLSPFNTVQVV